MQRVLSNISYDLDPKVKGQIMYFLVKTSSILLDISISNFAGA